MPYRLLADAVLAVHFAFVLFVALGGFAVLRRPRLAWLHLPAAAWGSLIEFAGWICPLTPLEQRWRERAGETAYSGDFVGHYITRWLYPAGLTRTLQVVLGAAVLALNVALYVVVWRRRRRSHEPS